MIQKNCDITGQPFGVSEEEKSAYEFFDIPLPSTCPDERRRRMLAFRNEHQFFWRNCDVTKEKIYSSFSQSASFPVVSAEYWWSDNWNPLEFGREFDFKRLFVEQLFDLWKSVPRPALVNRQAETSPSVQHCQNVKNCSQLVYAHNASNCHHSYGVSKSENCFDCYFVDNCSDCYEALHCVDSTALRWADWCSECHDCWFVSNCTSCRNCLFCSNLNGAQYCVFNKQVTAEEYYTTLSELNLKATQLLERAKERYQEFLVDQPDPHSKSDFITLTSGNYLRRCQAAFESFDCVNSINVLYCHALHSARDCIDGFGFGFDLERAINFVEVGDKASDIINCIECWRNVHNLTYCSYCEDSSNLFACVGLRGKQYCILNKQYTEQEYHQRLESIVDHLKSRSLWGKFFPASFSAHAYNHSSANVHMPLGKIPAKMMGFRWDEASDEMKPSLLLSQSGSKLDSRIGELPEQLSEETRDFVAKNVYICELTGRPYKIIPAELEFCLRNSIAPPVRCFEQRHEDRLRKMTPHRLQLRNLGSPPETVYTAFPETWRRPVLPHGQWVKAIG